jgi:hypothetical protein
MKIKVGMMKIKVMMMEIKKNMIMNMMMRMIIDGKIFIK